MPEAGNSVVYVLNRVSTSPQKDKSPYKLWFDKDFQLNSLKQFGTTVSVHVPKQRRLKLDTKNKLGIFVGYCSLVKGYRVYFPEDKKKEINRDIIFLPKITEENNNKENKKLFF